MPISEAFQVTGKGPSGTRFVDVNKGDANNPNYRSRFVAMYFKKGSPSSELFAGMPPLEAKKFLLSLAASGLSYKGEQGKLGFVVIKKAYLYAKARRPIYVCLPPGEEQEGMCGRSQRQLVWDARCCSKLGVHLH